MEKKLTMYHFKGILDGAKVYEQGNAEDLFNGLKSNDIIEQHLPVYCFQEVEGFARIQHVDNRDFNFFKHNDTLISNTWYNWAWDFCNGFARIWCKNKGYNFLRPDGSLLSDTWYDTAWDFNEGVAKVKREDGKYNFLKADGTHRSQNWFYESIVNFLTPSGVLFSQCFYCNDSNACKSCAISSDCIAKEKLLAETNQ